MDIDPVCLPDLDVPYLESRLSLLLTATNCSACCNLDLTRIFDKQGIDTQTLMHCQANYLLSCMWISSVLEILRIVHSYLLWFIGAKAQGRNEVAII